MTSPTDGHHGDHHDGHDERALDAFLRGDDALSRALREVPQPEPSADLNQRIMADAERALGAPAANDTLPPSERSAPAGGWFRRLRMPLAVAASLTVAVLIGLQWRTAPHDDVPMLAGTAPGTAVPPETQPPPLLPPDAAAPAAPAPPEPDASAVPARPRPAPARPAPPAQDRSARARTMIAQQDPPQDLALGSVIMRGMPSPEDASAAPTVPDNATPEAWLTAIERLLAEDRPADARRAWQQFRAAHPRFPVPDPLARRLDALQP